MVARREMPSPRCLSDYRIDAWLAGELRDTALRDAEAHFAECPHCLERKEAFSSSYEEMRKRLPPLPAKRVRSFRAWPGAVVGGLTLAAAVLLFIRAKDGDGSVDTTRLKGGDKVAFFIEQAGRVRSGFPGERVHPGDKLQFAYSARHPARVLVVSLDGEKNGSVYADGANEVPATTGNELRALPTSIVLDEVLGEELIVGLVCDGPQDAPGLRARLLREREKLKAPAGCTASRWTIVKEAPSP